MVSLCCSFDLYWDSDRGLLSLSLSVFSLATHFPKAVGILYRGELYLPIGDIILGLKSYWGGISRQTESMTASFISSGNKLINSYNKK